MIARRLQFKIFVKKTKSLMQRVLRNLLFHFIYYLCIYFIKFFANGGKYSVNKKVGTVFDVIHVYIIVIQQRKRMIHRRRGIFCMFPSFYPDVNGTCDKMRDLFTRTWLTTYLVGRCFFFFFSIKKG